MKKKYIILLGLLIVGFYLIMRVLGFSLLEHLELVTFNFRMRLRGPIEKEEKVKIVAIDNKSLANLYYNENDPWPWSRGVYAELINRLGRAEAKSIIMDISFDTLNNNDLAGDRKLAQSLFTHPYVTIGSYLINDKKEFAKLDEGYQKDLAQNKDYLRFRYQLSNINTYTVPNFFSPYLFVPPENLFMNAAWAYSTYEVGLPDEDGIYHSIPLVINEEYLNDQQEGSLVLFPNIDILGLTAYFGLEPGDYVFDLKNKEIELGDKRTIPVDKNGYFKLNYYGKEAFEEISVVEVLNMKKEELKEEFADKMVLIGYTAEAKGLFDARPTPFNKNEAGVQIHATAVQNILDELYLQRVPFVVNLVVIFTLFFIAVEIASISDLKLSIGLNLVWLIVYNIINYLLFINNIWLDLFYPDFILIIFLLFNTIYKVYIENKERLQTKNFFSRYVPAPVVDEILEDPSQVNPGGEEKEITVLFTDIVGFTSISEELEPAKLVRLLNEYFTEMTEIIKDEYGGTIDKFIGDAILAIFGAPFARSDDALRAVKTALLMQEKSKELEKRWQSRGEDVVFEIGIGINTGLAVVGNIGAPDRINYTCIGDAVNVGARLESATREVDAGILISSSTYQRVKDHFECERIEGLKVKGKKEPLTVYRVISANESLKEEEDYEKL